jgi:hypothetical protein
VRVSHSGSLETIASGLTFPTAMTFGPDGNLYVSNNGFGLFTNGGVHTDLITSGRNGGASEVNSGSGCRPR